MSNNIKVEYWIELWNELIDNFLKGSFGLTLYNPHILIDDIITEIEDNSFKNSDNKKFFYSKISNYLENDLVIKNKLKSQFKILRQVFNTGRIYFTLEASKDIKRIFQEGLYFDSSLELLEELLTSDKEVTLDFIYSLDYLTQVIIVELIKKGYSIKEIKGFLNNVFDSYSITKDNRLITKFPHEFNYEHYYNSNGELERDRYNNDVIDYISKLSNKDRIEKLSYYYYKKKEKVNYIFVIEGLKGEIDIDVAGVSFYSLNKKRYTIKKELEEDFEDIQRNQEKEKYIQASVEIDFLTPKSSLSDALTKLDNALNLLSGYFNSKTDFYPNTSNYIIVQNERTIFVALGSKKRDSAEKHFNSLDISMHQRHLDKLNKHSFLWNGSNINKKSISKITNALHWYRKAEHSLKKEDKLLNYWIALENLFNLEIDIKLDVLNDANKNKFHLIQEIISSNQIFGFIYDYGWELYNYYSSIVNFPFPSRMNFSDDLIKRANLQVPVGEKISLKKFVDNLNEIKSFESNPFMLDKISKVLNFYEDPKTTKKIIEEQISQVKDDVLMIYRFRNLIVHNAHFDNTLLPYFSWKIKVYSGNLVRKLISNFSNEKGLSELVLGLYLKKERFLLDLESGKVNLFKS